jgi:hypothetical protein
MPDDAPNPMKDQYPIHDSAPTLTTQQARQGETSGRMRIVLGISLLVAILAVVGLAFDWHQARSPPAQSIMPPATNAQDTAPSAPQPHGQVPGNTTPTPPNNQGN